MKRVAAEDGVEAVVAERNAAGPERVPVLVDILCLDQDGKPLPDLGPVAAREDRSEILRENSDGLLIALRGLEDDGTGPTEIEPNRVPVSAASFWPACLIRDAGEGILAARGPLVTDSKEAVADKRADHRSVVAPPRDVDHCEDGARNEMASPADRGGHRFRQRTHGLNRWMSHLSRAPSRLPMDRPDAVAGSHASSVGVARLDLVG